MDQDLDGVQRDAIAREKLLQVGMDQLGDLVDLLVDLLQRGELDDLVDGLLHHGPGVVVDVLHGDGVSVGRHMLHQQERMVRVGAVDVVVDVVLHLAILAAQADTLGGDYQLAPIDE